MFSADSLVDIVTIRGLEASDINFILDSSQSCLGSYTESIFKGYQRPAILKHIEAVTLYALNRADKYSTFLACHKENTNSILAYIVANPKTNHVLYQYTKYDYRNMGIQKYMLLPLVVDDSIPVTVNYQTKWMLKLAESGKVTIANKFVEALIEEGL